MADHGYEKQYNKNQTIHHFCYSLLVINKWDARYHHNSKILKTFDDEAYSGQYIPNIDILESTASYWNKLNQLILTWQAFADLHVKATSSGLTEMLD